tara:strand:- start:2027 stop:2236 length:210 start_codon:yes stop_codon:yes gene_type:complete
MNLFSAHINRIKGPVSPVQLREVLSHLTLLNYKLKNLSSYRTKVDSAMCAPESAYIIKMRLNENDERGK